MLAVGRPFAFALMSAGRVGDVVHRAVLGRKGEQVAARDDQHAFAIGREVEGEHLVSDIPVFGTAVHVVVLQVDGHFLTLSGLDGVLVDVTAVLEDDIVLRIGRELAVVFLEIGDLAGLFGLRVIDEQVHDAVSVGEIVDLIADPHGEDVLGIVVADFLELGGAHLVDPDIVGLAAPVVFPSAELAEHPVHGQLFAVGRIAAETAFGGRNLFGRTAFRVNLAELAAQAAEAPLLAAIDDLLAVGRPAHDDVVGSHALAHEVAAHEGRVRDAPGFTACDGNGVDFGVAVVLAGEGHGLAVGRDAREYFVAHVGGQLLGGAAVDADAIEVAGVAEDDVVASHGREPEQTRLLTVCRECQQRQQRRQHDKDSLHRHE